MLKVNTRIIEFLLLITGVFGVGCAREVIAPKKKFKPLTFTFNADPSDKELYDTAVKAADMWSEVTGRIILVSPKGDIPIFRVQAENMSCQGASYLGCATDNQYDNPDARIEIKTDIEQKKLLNTLLHEMGHILRGDSEHIPAGTQDVMCSQLQDVIPERPTKNDTKFICQNFDCANQTLD